MTTPGLMPWAFPSVSRVVVSWLQTYFGAGTVGLRRPQSGVLPYRMVATVAGTETCEKIRQCATVSVHTFADNMDDAEYQSQLTHQRMLFLAPPLVAPQSVTITLPDSTTQTVEPDSITTKQIPTWADYQDDLIYRFIARYEICLRTMVNPNA